MRGRRKEKDWSKSDSESMYLLMSENERMCSSVLLSRAHPSISSELDAEQLEDSDTDFSGVSGYFARCS